MGLRDKYKGKFENNGFKPLNLSEGNVHALFSRCLSTDNTKEMDFSILFSTLLGYSEEHMPIRI